MARPESYRNITPKDCCKTCVHRFVKHEYEEGDTYLCQYGDTEQRPPCGSVFMGESFVGLSEDEWDAAEKEWDDYAISRRVSEYGICDKYERRV